MKTKQELIKEAIARGIKPGAVVRDHLGDVWTVPSWENATHRDDGCIYFKNIPCRNGDMSYTNNGCVVSYNGTWATVITPAQEDNPEGLVDGMACEPDEHMRAAIVAKSVEIGSSSGKHPIWGKYFYWDAQEYRLLQGDEAPSKPISTGEFYDRLCRTPKPEPRISIGGHEVKFCNGSIRVCCTTVPNDIVRKVAERLKD